MSLQPENRAARPWTLDAPWVVLPFELMKSFYQCGIDFESFCRDRETRLQNAETSISVSVEAEALQRG
jgi:hypothetical protein